MMKASLSAVHRTLGIDPGLVATGWAIVEDRGSRRVLVCGGTIMPCVKASVEERLAILAKEVHMIIEEQHPQDACLENIFIGGKTSPHSVLQLGRAQGVILMLCGKMQLASFFYQPTTIKKIITNNGHATKKQIAKMLPFFLKRSDTKPLLHNASEHQNDAVAVALCHLRHRKSPLFQIRSKRDNP